VNKLSALSDQPQEIEIEIEIEIETKKDGGDSPRFPLCLCLSSLSSRADS
jgi:hypothetical protein